MRGTASAAFVANRASRSTTLIHARKLPVIYFNGRRVCPPVGDPSGAIEDRVAPLPGEMVLTKSSSGPLASTNLEQVLRNMGIRSLVVCGLTAAVCVSQTARELADLGFQVIVAEDACTELSDESHRAALLMFALTFGRVRPTGQIVELFAAAPAGPNQARRM